VCNVINFGFCEFGLAVCIQQLAQLPMSANKQIKNYCASRLQRSAFPPQFQSLGELWEVVLKYSNESSQKNRKRMNQHPICGLKYYSLRIVN